MRTVVAGSREIKDYQLVKSVLDNCRWRITEVVCGEAPGPDRLGKRWANENNIPVRSFPANWDRWPRSAGPKRNAEMGLYASECEKGPGGLVLLWDGSSAGSKNMLETGVSFGLAIEKHLCARIWTITKTVHID